MLDSQRTKLLDLARQGVGLEQGVARLGLVWEKFLADLKKDPVAFAAFSRDYDEAKVVFRQRDLVSLPVTSA